MKYTNHYNEEIEIKEGDFMYASWGYAQTNIDYFKVTKTTDKSIYVIPVLSEIVETGKYENKVAPTDEEDTNSIFSSGLLRCGKYGFKVKGRYPIHKYSEPKSETGFGCGH